MKIAISGKGGTGKTTLAAVLARIFASEGRAVLAIDADPDANLASALGFSVEETRGLRPISEMKELIEERTGSRPGSGSLVFKMNPKVDDIPERFSILKNGIKLVLMGTVKKGGSGCYCPENILLKGLLMHLMLERDEVVIVDMEAGVEHLSRGTAMGVDALIVTVEPGLRSIETARRVKKLASDVGIKRVFVVGNKVRGEEDLRFLESNLKDFEILGFISFSPGVIACDLEGASPYDRDKRLVEEVSRIKQGLEQILSS